MSKNQVVVNTYQKQLELVQEYMQTIQSKLEQQRPCDAQMHWGYLGKLAHVLGKLQETMELIDL